MRTLRMIVLSAIMIVMLAIPSIVSAQIIYVVCAGYDARRNCNHCSDYFSVQTEEEAQKRCEAMGLPTPHYFRSVQAIFNWKRPNCSCPD